MARPPVSSWRVAAAIARTAGWRVVTLATNGPTLTRRVAAPIAPSRVQISGIDVPPIDTPDTVVVGPDSVEPGFLSGHGRLDHLARSHVGRVDRQIGQHPAILGAPVSIRNPLGTSRPEHAPPSRPSTGPGA